MAVPDTKLRNAKPEDKRYRIKIGDSVYLEVMPTGKKIYRMRYRRPITKKQAILTIGSYDDISQPDAQQEAREAKRLLKEGIDPSEHKKQQQLIRQQEAERVARQAANSFEKVARAWHLHRHKTKKDWSDRHAEKIMVMLSADVFPEIGHIPIANLKAPDLLEVIQAVVDRGAPESARKLNQWINAIYRYAKLRRLVQSNEADDLRDELPVINRKNNPYLNSDDLHEFINDVEQGNIGEIVKIGILLTLHTLARTGEIRFAKWSEFDFENRLWSIPAERMKMKRPHVIPLSKQAIELLERLRAFTGQYDYLFVTRGWNKPMSENAMLYALYRLGWKGRVTIHGLRGTGSTILNEAGFRSDWVELALAHVDGNAVRAAYNHSIHLDGRREMLQWYSDYLDGLRDGAHVIPINRKLR